MVTGPFITETNFITSGMPRQTLYLWKQAPFLRLVIPFMAGILLQWYSKWPPPAGWILFIAGIAAFTAFNQRPAFRQYQWRWVNGAFVNISLFATGLLITYYKDVSHQPEWINKYYQDKDVVSAVLTEPLAEKTNSFKATASVQQVYRNDSTFPVKGNIIIYFRKGSSSHALPNLSYGSQILFSRTLQPIRNSGNPGTFDYERYAAFQGIYHQVFLEPGSYTLLPVKKENPLTAFLFNVREKVLNIIARYIPGKKEAGLAEALLVGYKDDLDKPLVQSYSNTGVVHIIAISGMHMGLIYWLLGIVFSPLKKRKQTRWMVMIFTIAGLWLFALLAGGGPSILRSAVMFTCIVIAESAARKTFIYNSLAASAFILLCINPFWLWDAGFQLSYAAVLSIVVFMKPVYNWFYFKNKFVDNIWKLLAVSLAAQVLTTPVSIYHFHQFPIYFLFTNLLAVPLSSLIVLLEIGLCAVSFVPAIAGFTGIALYWLIYFMNSFIAYMEHLPFSLLNNLQVNYAQLLLLYGIIAGLGYWLLHKNKMALLAGLASMLCFAALRSLSFIQAASRQQMVVYNVPRHRVIGFISGRNTVFKGDSGLLAEQTLQAFYLNNAVTELRSAVTDSIGNLLVRHNFFVFNNRKIVLVDTSCELDRPGDPIAADLLVVSGNPPVSMNRLMEKFSCRAVVFDASNPARMVNKWKKEAAKLGLSCFYTVDNGAFVMNMD